MRAGNWKKLKMALVCPANPTNSPVGKLGVSAPNINELVNLAISVRKIA